MKIVLDTDVVLSSLLSRRGASHKVIRWLAEGYASDQRRFTVVSNTQIVEFSAVLKRKEHLERSGLSPLEVEAFIDALVLISHRQKISYLWRPFLKDVNDDMVLETAFNANADYIVTHNFKDFKNVESTFGIKVVTPQTLLKKLGVNS
jgi:putative PIN family toxin of toxin-antitoxin system